MTGVQQDAQMALGRNNYRGIASAAIGSDAIGEEVTLQDKAIQSVNYIPNISGWRIDGYGDAEFANVYVRGDINAYSGTIGYWNISSPLVKRSFGAQKLFGTFLESSDLGTSDDDVTSGTYVGLYKSYIDEGSPITSVLRDSGLSTLTSVGHNYQVGDLVDISIITDTTFNGTGITITNVTTDTFSYSQFGLTNVSATDVEGSVTLSIEDVAGLYLADYSKTNFDYGYISNKGLAYVSAADVNLIHNPSFEYSNTGLSVDIAASTVGWIQYGSSSTSNAFVDILSSRNPALKAESMFGGKVEWSTAVGADDDYWAVPIDYSVADDYHLFANDRTLTFDFDMFLDQTRTAIRIVDASAGASSSTVSDKSITSNVATLHTSTDHGFAIGQSVVVTNTDKVITVTNKARTLTTVTLTFASQTHQIIVGDTITVAISDANYDGTYTVSAQTATTISYSKTSATTQTTTAATGTITHNLFNGTYTITGVHTGVGATSYYFTYAKTHANYTLATVSGTAVLSTGGSQVRVTTSAAHNLAVGDTISMVSAIISDAISSDNYSILNYTAQTYNGRSYVSKIFTVTAVPSSTTFCYTNPRGTAANLLQLIPDADIYPIAYIEAVGGVSTTTVTVYIDIDNTVSRYHPYIVGDVVYVAAFDASGNQYAFTAGTGSPYTITEVTRKTFKYVVSGVYNQTKTYSYPSSLYLVDDGVKFYYPNTYKVQGAAFDLSKIQIQYGTSTAARGPLSDVLATAETNWSNKSIRKMRAEPYINESIGNWLTGYIDAMNPMTAANTSPILISSADLYSQYNLLNPTELASGVDMYLLFPRYLNQLSLDGTTVSSSKVVTSSTNTKMSYILDNVQLSTSSEFFFGNTSEAEHSWYDEPTAATLGPGQASIKNPKHWVDINLDSQTARLEFDWIGLNNPSVGGFSKQLFNNAYIGPFDSSNGTPGAPNGTTDLSSISMASGEYSYTVDNFPGLTHYLKSDISAFSGEGVSGFLLKAAYNGSVGPDYFASISGWMDSTTVAGPVSSITIDSDSSTVNNLKTNYSSIVGTDLTSFTGISSEYFAPESAYVSAQLDVSMASTTWDAQTTGSGTSRKMTANSCFVVVKASQTGRIAIDFSVRGNSASASGSLYGTFAIYPFSGNDSGGYPYIGRDTPIYELGNIDCVAQTSGTANNSSSAFWLWDGATPGQAYVIAVGIKSNNAAYTVNAVSRYLRAVPVL